MCHTLVGFDLRLAPLLLALPLFNFLFFDGLLTLLDLARARCRLPVIPAPVVAECLSRICLPLSFGDTNASFKLLRDFFDDFNALDDLPRLTAAKTSNTSNTHIKH